MGENDKTDYFAVITKTRGEEVRHHMSINPAFAKN